MFSRSKSLEKRARRNVPLPEGVDWSRRAVPQEVMASEGYTGISAAGMDNALRRLRAISRQNATFMRHMLASNNGVVHGFHGTTTANAESIRQYGFQNRINDEGRKGVSAWATVVGHEAIRFAKDRSAAAGAADEGAIVQVEMTDPLEDTDHGRLEWLADASKTQVVNVYTVPEFREYLIRTGNVALSGTVEPPVQHS